VIEKPCWTEGHGRLRTQEQQGVEVLSGGDEGEGTRRSENRGMLVGAEAMSGWAASSGCRMGVPEAQPRLVVEVVGQRLVELEVGDELGIDGVEPRCLVEQEIPLRWPASGREGRRSVGQVEVQKDGG
jgi:hypothetical protein